VQQIDGVTVNGHLDRQNAPHIVSVSIEGVRAEVMLHALEDKQIYVSAGSACSSNKPAVSRTLKSIGVKSALLDSTIRFSFSVHTTMEEIDYALTVLRETIPMLQKYTRH
jgi:cysteine desulfurase